MGYKWLTHQARVALPLLSPVHRHSFGLTWFRCLNTFATTDQKSNFISVIRIQFQTIWVHNKAVLLTKVFWNFWEFSNKNDNHSRIQGNISSIWGKKFWNAQEVWRLAVLPKITLDNHFDISSIWLFHVRLLSIIIPKTLYCLKYVSGVTDKH